MTRGSCDCQGVRYRIDGAVRDVYNCHCERCRKITGHFMAATACAPDALIFDSDETLRWYEPAPGVFYGFCSTCGSTLFWKSTQPDGSVTHMAVAAGGLDTPTGLRTTKAWWIATASDYHERQPGLEEFDLEG